MRDHVTIPLNNANLCLDCRRIGDSDKACPKCQSRALQALATVLDRETCVTVGSSYPSICMEAI